MAKKCQICGKGPLFGHNVSHSHQKTLRRWNPNLHKVRAIIDGSPKNVYVCAKCLKSDKLVRA